MSAEQKVICPECKTHNSVGSAFCSKCGTRLVGVAPTYIRSQFTPPKARQPMDWGTRLGLIFAIIGGVVAVSAVAVVIILSSQSSTANSLEKQTAQAVTLVAGQRQATAAIEGMSAQQTVSILTNNATPIYGPNSDKLKHIKDQVATWSASVNQSDFIAEATFSNPYDGADYPWDYGFVFRAGPTSQYRLDVGSNGKWFVDYVEGPQGSEKFTQDGKGVVDGMDTSAAGANTLRLVVRGSTAWFFANTHYIATITVARPTQGGDVMVGTGFASNDIQPGSITRYEGFRVWAIQ